jgi:hypothetical protein
MSSGEKFNSEMGFHAVVWSNTPLLVERDNSLPGAVLADFALLVGARRWFPLNCG